MSIYVDMYMLIRTHHLLALHRVVVDAGRRNIASRNFIKRLYLHLHMCLYIYVYMVWYVYVCIYVYIY